MYLTIKTEHKDSWKTGFKISPKQWNDFIIVDGDRASITDILVIIFENEPIYTQYIKKRNTITWPIVMVNISNLQDNEFGMSVVGMPHFMTFTLLFHHTRPPLKLKITKTICGVHSPRPYI